jgi:TolA protein
MNLTRQQKALYGAGALWLIWVGLSIVGGSIVVAAVLAVLFVIGWVLALRYTNPRVKHLPPVERFGVGIDPRPSSPTAPALPSDLAADGQPLVIVPHGDDEQARLAAQRKARDAERAAERAEADAAERDRVAAEAEAQAERDRRAAEARTNREADELELRQAEDQAAREAEDLARRETEALARREAEVEEARREAEVEERREADEQAERHAEENARLEAEAEARRQAEARQRREAEIEARREADDEAERRAEAEERRTAEQASRGQAAGPVIDEGAVQSDQDILDASGVAALDGVGDADAAETQRRALLDKVRSRLHDYE